MTEQIDNPETTAEVDAPESPGTATTEPEPLGDPGKKALDAERSSRRAAEREAKEARERLGNLERAERVRAVAADANLSSEQAEFLSGDTEEELAESAERLLKAFQPGDDVRRRPRERLRSGAVPGAEPDEKGAMADEIIRGI